MRWVAVTLVVAVAVLAQVDAKVSVRTKSVAPSKNVTPEDVEGSGDDEYDDSYAYKDDGKDDEDWSGDLFDDDEDNVKPSSVSKTKVVDAANEMSPSIKKKPSDIHFDDAGTASKSGKAGEDSTILYEYYNELYEKDYEDEDDEDTKSGTGSKIGADDDEEEDDDDEDDDEDDDDDDEEENIIASRPNAKAPGVFSTSSGSVPVPSPADPETDSFFKLSYVYIMIASAVVTFMVASVLFFVCRRSALERSRKKAHLASAAPFVLSDRGAGHFGPDSHKKSSIVKNYHRVPTTTKEFLHSDYHYHAASPAESNEKKEPLLT